MDKNAETLARIINEMNRGMSSSRKAKRITEKIASGKATYADALEYAQENGRVLKNSISNNVGEVLEPDGRLFREAANVVIKTPMEESGRQVIDVAAEIEQSMNDAAGIGIKAIRPQVNEDQIDGIITGICNTESYKAGENTFLTQVGNFLEGTVDDVARKNAEFHYQAGLSPKIERRVTGKGCPRCDALAGVYDYEDVRDKGNPVFERHKNCHCVVDYIPGNGAKRQNVHSKRWTDAGRDDRIRASERVSEEERRPPEQKVFESEVKAQARQSRNTLSGVIRDNPKVLENYTPETMYELLEQSGMNPQPLSRGSLKGKQFRDGGGYKVNYGGDGELQYHPADGSHHDGAYWKVSGGKEGITRYDENGNPK